MEPKTCSPVWEPSYEHFAVALQNVRTCYCVQGISADPQAAVVPTVSELGLVRQRMIYVLCIDLGTMAGQQPRLLQHICPLLVFVACRLSTTESLARLGIRGMLMCLRTL